MMNADAMNLPKLFFDWCRTDSVSAVTVDVYALWQFFFMALPSHIPVSACLTLSGDSRSSFELCSGRLSPARRTDCLPKMLSKISGYRAHWIPHALSCFTTASLSHLGCVTTLISGKHVFYRRKRSSMKLQLNLFARNQHLVVSSTSLLGHSVFVFRKDIRSKKLSFVSTIRLAVSTEAEGIG
ncbi:hypothetical protein B0H34DRAFT_691352 [Crassisporium funariophilum]|nr:hypothetical protein B0H34DRAFT_691352 [Crassisporium funariophilum]